MTKKKANRVQDERRARVRGERARRGRAVRMPPDDGIGAFPLGLDGAPISDETPGQAESWAAFEQFNEGRGKCPWWLEYLELRAEGWDWRKAALIAWLASPATKRWPRSQAELASQVLGLQSDRVLRKWREDDPKIDERVGRLQVEPLFKHRGDVIRALVKVAKTASHLAHSDRELFLKMTGDYIPKQKVEESGPNGGPLVIRRANELSDDDLAAIAANGLPAGCGGGVEKAAQSA